MGSLKTIQLSEIAEFRNGLNFSKASNGVGCKIIGVSDFKNQFIPDYEQLNEINPMDITKKEDYLKEGDIVFVRSNGNKVLVGRSLYINKNIPLLFSGFCIRLRLIRDEVTALFLVYFCKTNRFKKSISALGGTSIQNLNQQILGTVNVPLFSKDKQKNITNILFNLDKKIELNNKINQKLEAMAKTLYDYWFVQFDFPDEYGKPYKSSGGKMVYNDELKREIPEGWEVRRLDEIAIIKKGTLITEKIADSKGKYKVVSAGINHSYFHSEYNQDKFTITISASGANAGFINFWREKFFACDCTVVNGKSFTETFMLLEFLKLRQNYIYKQARGSAQPHVYPKDISNLKMEVAPKKLIQNFGKLVISLNEKIAINQIENQKLTQQRDWLLPMLMNGQVGCDCHHTE